jgi:hypothetical protein
MRAAARARNCQVEFGQGAGFAGGKPIVKRLFSNAAAAWQAAVSNSPRSAIDNLDNCAISRDSAAAAASTFNPGFFFIVNW